MFVVVFRAQARELDEAYAELADRLREKALTDFGCCDFISATTGNTEIALSYWHSEEDIRSWKAYADHAMAQGLGRERWYESYSVQVGEIRREYKFQA